MDTRDEYGTLTKKGLPFILAGALYMFFASVVVLLMPIKSALMLCMVATGVIFPLAFGIATLLKVNPFAPFKPLSQLGTVLAAIQLLYWPVLIIIYIEASLWLPFAMAVLFGSHFLPYGWLFKSKGYTFLGLMMPIVASVMAFGGEEFSYQFTFWAMTPLYCIAAALVMRENSQMRQATTPNPMDASAKA